MTSKQRFKGADHCIADGQTTMNVQECAGWRQSAWCLYVKARRKGQARDCVGYVDTRSIAQVTDKRWGGAESEQNGGERDSPSEVVDSFLRQPSVGGECIASSPAMPAVLDAKPTPPAPVPAQLVPNGLGHPPPLARPSKQLEYRMWYSLTDEATATSKAS